MPVIFCTKSSALVEDLAADSNQLIRQQQGREGLKQVIRAFRSAFPDICWVIEEMVGEGDKVFSRVTWHGTHGGEFFGIPATEKEITVKGMVILIASWTARWPTVES